MPLDCQIKRVKSNKCVKNHTSLWPSLMHSTALCVKNHQSKLRKMLGFHKYAFLDESVRRQFSNQKRETYQFKKCDKMYRWFLNILQIKVIVVLWIGGLVQIYEINFVAAMDSSCFIWFLPFWSPREILVPFIAVLEIFKTC